MPLNKKIALALFVLCLTTGFNSYSQSPTIPGTGTSAATCGTCAPVGWNNTGGTPDISDRNFVGGQGTLGAQASWNIGGVQGQLPLPPNGDVRWITMRDVGDFNIQEPENVTTQIDGLIVGKLYKITYFVMSAFSNEDGGANITTPGTGSDFYGGSYMDNFDYQLSNVNNTDQYPSVNIVITEDY